jgi:hypothetical protein
MRVKQTPKQEGGKLYGSGCVQLSAQIRRQEGLKDGDKVKVWVRVYDPATAKTVGEATFEAILTSGGEIYVAKHIPGAQPGQLVDLILLS